MDTNSANDHEEILPLGAKIKLSDLYDKYTKGYFPYSDSEDFEQRFGSSEPQVHFKCVEATKEWLQAQDYVIGCVFNINDPDLLQILSQMTCDIAVSYNQGWMDAKNEPIPDNPKFLKEYEWRQKEYSKNDHLYRQTNGTELLFPPGHPWGNALKPLCGIRVFRHKEVYKRYPSAMHHKFLIGTKNCDGKDKKSLLYGTFNWSETSPMNLDSVLIFNENDKLIDTFEFSARRILLCSAPWNILSDYGFDQWIKAMDAWHECRDYIFESVETEEN